jgi:hypothetical protein
VIQKGGDQIQALIFTVIVANADLGDEDWEVFGVSVVESVAVAIAVKPIKLAIEPANFSSWYPSTTLKSGYISLSLLKILVRRYE